jgi:hypothetical protein
MLAGWRESDPSEPIDAKIMLSDGSEHASWADADAYIQAHYPENGMSDDTQEDGISKLLLTGSAATIGIAGIYLVARRHMKKDL